MSPSCSIKISTSDPTAAFEAFEAFKSSDHLRFAANDIEELWKMVVAESLEVGGALAFGRFSNIL